MTGPTRFLLALPIGLATMAAPLVARADDSAAAQALFDQGKKAMAARNYAEACPKLEESYRLQEALGTLLNLADCYERQGKLASAWSKFLEVSAKARAVGQAERARIGHDRAAALAPKLSNLVIDVPASSRVDGLEVRRDGTIVGSAEWGSPIPADTGAHAIAASAPGRKAWSQTVTLPEGVKTSTATVPELDPLPVESSATPAVALTTGGALSLPTSPAPGPESPARGGGDAQRIVALVAGGAGVAAVGVGAAFGILSLSKHNDAANVCPDPGPCPSPNGVSLRRDAYDFGNVSTAAFIGGGVGLAAGVVLWLTAPRHAGHREPVARVAIGPETVAVMGVW